MTTTVAPKLDTITATAHLRDLWQLTKPRVTTLVVFTGIVGLHVAQGPKDVALFFWTLLGCSLLVASANTLNCYIERHSDALMSRTRNRPLPAGRVEPWEALLLGNLLLVVSLPMLALGANLATALLGILAHLGYVMVYTPMKRTSTWATLVGGVPGAMPPLMGYVAVTGTLDVAGLLLFAVLFVWQIPHTLAIGLLRKDEYAAAGIRVVPGAYSERAVGTQILLTTALLVVTTLGLAAVELAGVVYLALSVVLGAVFLFTAFRRRNQDTRGYARGVFLYSMAYLSFLLMALSLDKTAG
ncbi:MAG: heme o synthase [Myxococcota bacterium]